MRTKLTIIISIECVDTIVCDGYNSMLIYDVFKTTCVYMHFFTEKLLLQSTSIVACDKST